MTAGGATALPAILRPPLLALWLALPLALAACAEDPAPPATGEMGEARALVAAGEMIGSRPADQTEADAERIVPQ